MRSQIVTGLTFCRVAETELAYGRADITHGILEKLRKLCETLRRHLSEPNHVPPNEVDKLETELAQLDSRVAIEERVRHNR
jgi:hypothetical protein